LRIEVGCKIPGCAHQDDFKRGCRGEASFTIELDVDLKGELRFLDRLIYLNRTATMMIFHNI